MCEARHAAAVALCAQSFRDRVVIITGASGGIGAITAQHFASLGASLALVGRNFETLQLTVAQCAKIAVVPPLSVIADVTTDAERIVATTVAHFGRLDVLVNNAGRGVYGSLEATTIDHLDDALNVNLRSIFQLTKCAVPHLLLTKGNVVNVSSVVGMRAFADILPYSVSKAAVDQFTRCVALELAPRGVRVNSVNPAVIRSDFQRNAGMGKEAYDKYMEACKLSHAMGRVGEPSEVATAIAFLADNEKAAFVTGTLLAVDGGKAIMCPR